MLLSEVKEILRAKVVVGEEKPDRKFKAGVGTDLMSDLLRIPSTDVILLTGLNNVQVIRTSLIAGAEVVILVRGKNPIQEVIEQAYQHNITLLSTPLHPVYCLWQAFQ